MSAPARAPELWYEDYRVRAEYSPDFRLDEEDPVAVEDLGELRGVMNGYTSLEVTERAYEERSENGGA